MDPGCGACEGIEELGVSEVSGGRNGGREGFYRVVLGVGGKRGCGDAVFGSIHMSEPRKLMRELYKQRKSDFTPERIWLCSTLVLATREDRSKASLRQLGNPSFHMPTI